jgi:hypothetical protein
MSSISASLRQRREQGHAWHRHDGEVDIEEVILQTRKREKREKGSASRSAPVLDARFIERIARPCLIDKPAGFRVAGVRLCGKFLVSP